MNDFNDEWMVNHFNRSKGPYIYLSKSGHYSDAEMATYIRRLPGSENSYDIRDYSGEHEKQGKRVAGPFPSLDVAKAAFVIIFGRANK